MSTDNMKDKLKGNFGALQGLKKQESSDNNNDNQNHNRIDNENENTVKNNNENPTDSSNSNVSNIEDKLKGLALKSKKRKIKNVTYGLYEDQQEDMKKIAAKLDIGINELMRESMDLVIELLKQQLQDR